MIDDAGTVSDDLLEQIVEQLWADVRGLRQKWIAELRYAGKRSPQQQEVAKAIGVSPARLSEWLNCKDCFVPEWLKFQEIVQYFTGGEPAPAWRQRWRDAHTAYEARKAKQPETRSQLCQSIEPALSAVREVEAARNDNPASKCNSPNILMESNVPSIPPRDLPLGEIAECLVTLTCADVYSAPGDFNPIVRKMYGDCITFPRNVPDFTAQDGRRYRMVRTPTRTLSGYAFMLTDALGSR